MLLQISTQVGRQDVPFDVGVTEIGDAYRPLELRPSRQGLIKRLHPARQRVGGVVYDADHPRRTRVAHGLLRLRRGLGHNGGRNDGFRFGYQVGQAVHCRQLVAPYGRGRHHAQRQQDQHRQAQE